jgi:thymidylate synthase (FAD)
MKIITAPSIHVLSVPQFFEHPEYKVPPDGTDGERLIAHAGKGCYDSYGEDGRSCEAHIRQLVDVRHGSVLEHCNVSLFLSGISRGCSHEIVRHRHFAYSQRSTRYTAEEGAAIVLDPFYAPLYEKWGEQYSYWRYRGSPVTKEMGDVAEYFTIFKFMLQCDLAIETYGEAVNQLMKQAPQGKSKVEQRKWARGKARQLLPHALETRMTMTGNLRAWRHFIEERTHPTAEPEIRRLAELIYTQLSVMYPFVFADYEAVLQDGFIHARTVNRKV